MTRPGGSPSLGLSELVAESKQVESQKQQLTKREVELEREMAAVIRGALPDAGSPYYRPHCDAERAINQRQTVHEEELLGQTDRGRRILKLREEREGLLDTVWLATSPTQIRALWSKVGELLCDEPTQLQRDALAIEPVTAM
ncbi:MAG: hypothetical protein HYX69_00465 [Planctomycetia bacterium]|nr:hypothetical protein [Planctomycetia bacterium]